MGLITQNNGEDPISYLASAISQTQKVRVEISVSHGQKSGGSDNSKQWRRSDFVFGKCNFPNSESEGGNFCISWPSSITRSYEMLNPIL